MFLDAFTIRTWFGSIALLAGSSCGAAQTSVRVELPAEVGPLPKELEDEYRVFAVNCSKCHGLERPLTAPVSGHKHWERYVGKMMRTPGSGISSNEAPSILAFLFWYTDKKNGHDVANDNGSEPVNPQLATPSAAPSEQVVEPEPAPTEGEKAP